MLCGLGHVAVYADDIGWYQALLQDVFQMKVTRSEPGQLWFDGGIQLVQKKGTADGGPLAHICIRVPDVHAYRERLLQRGAALYAPDPNMLELPNKMLLELKPKE